MAGNDKQKPVDVAAQPAADKSKGVIVMLVVLAVLVIFLTPVITIFAFKVMTSKTSEAVQIKTETSEISLPRIQVNVFQTQGSRYAQVDVVVLVNDSSMRDLFTEQSATNPKGQLRRIMAEAIKIIGSKPLTQLLAPDARDQLAEELKTAFNSLLSSHTKGLITDVYFPGFLVQ